MWNMNQKTERKMSNCQVELDLTILNLPGIPDAECELKALKKMPCNTEVYLRLYT